MPIQLRPLRTIQFPLFQSGPRTPRWEQLPSEVRQQTMRLLARMLNEHAEGKKLTSPATREASDE